MAHRNLPSDIEDDVLDIVAKALMIRLGSSVTISRDEMRQAGDAQAEFEIENDGSLTFRVERN